MQLPESLFYYSPKYFHFLEGLLGCSIKCLVAKSSGKIVGALPLAYTKGALGMVINSLPYYGSNGGPIAFNQDACSQLLLVYKKLIQKEGILSSTLISNPLSEKSFEHDIKPDLIDKRIGQWTPLSDQDIDAEALLMRFDSSARRNVRKALKKGVEVEIDNSAIEFLKNTHQSNMAQIGGLAKTNDFFELLPKHFNAGEDYDIYVASKSGEPIAALLVFYFNLTVEYFTPVVVESARNMQGLPCIIHKALCDAAQKGFKWWNWGGTWLSQDGVYRFKKKWAAEDKLYQYYTNIMNDELYSSSAETLLSEYSGFFVIPFSELKQSEEELV